MQLNVIDLRNPAASERSTFVSAAIRFLDFCTSAIRCSVEIGKAQVKSLKRYFGKVNSFNKPLITLYTNGAN